MTLLRHPDHDAFADWLDANPSSSNASVGDDTALGAASEGAIQIDTLNRHFEHHALTVAPGRTPWESILAAASPSPPALGMPNRWNTRHSRKENRVDSQFMSPASPVPIDRIGFGGRLNRIISIAAVVAILIAASATVWVNRDRLGAGGDGDGLETLSYASFMMPNGEEVEIAYVVPTEEDCTVEPLTVNEVIETLTVDPELWEYEVPRVVSPEEFMRPGTPTLLEDIVADGVATPSAEPVSYLPVPEPVHAEIAAVQREWLACSLFGSPFQRWALETSPRILAEFESIYFPAFNMAQIRHDLEALADGSDDHPFTRPALTDESLLPMVPSYSEGYYNLVHSESNIDITVFWVQPDGTPLLAFGKVEADIEPFLAQPSLVQRLPNAWNFRQNPDTGQWLLNDLTLGLA